MAFTIERYEDLKAGVCRIDGDIDSAVAPALQEALESLIDTGFVNIVLDVSRVVYADSAALSLLVGLDRRLRESDGKVVLAGASRNMRRVLEISRIVSVAPTLCSSDDVMGALEKFEPAEASAPELWSREIGLHAGIEDLASVREQVCELVMPLHFSEAALFDIRVALGEALANAVRHGSADSRGDIRIVVRAHEDRVVIEVIDSGSGFSGEHVCSDDLYASGGRGIMFMRALMDQVMFSPGEGGGTVVTLVKHRTAAEQS